MGRIKPSSGNSSQSTALGGKITVSHILRQSRSGGLSGTSAQTGAAPTTGGAPVPMTVVAASPPGAAAAAGGGANSGTNATGQPRNHAGATMGTVRGSTQRVLGRRRALAASGGRSSDEMVLSAELGTSAPIGPAVIELLSLAYRAGIPPLLIGAHGVGKSQIVAAAAAVLGIDCISRDLSLMEPPDLVGLPKIENGATTFLPPEFLPRDISGKGFLVIEEINRSPRYMQACCLELMTSRKLNSYTLPAGWLPVACLNPKSEGYAVDLLDAALTSRFMQITVCASVESWASWARSNGIHPQVIEYVTSVPNSLDESQGGSNPRSWAYASQTLKAAGPDLLARSPDTIVTALNGLIGPVHTTALLRMFFGTEVPLKPADVLRDWQTAKATMKRWLQQGRLDLLATSMRIMLQWLRPDGVAEELRTNVRQCGAVRSFFRHLGGDLAEQAKACLLELGHTHLIPDYPS